MEHYRWVNNNDLVTHVPPAWAGYRHTGKEMYINAYGRVRPVTGWQRTKDRLRGLYMGLKEGSIDSFSDHSMSRYIEYIQRARIERGSGTENVKTIKVFEKIGKSTTGGTPHR